MNEIFDTKWARTDTVKRLRHGMPWSDNELRNLRALYMNGTSLCGMAETLQRPADGVINKLNHLNLIKFCSATLRYRRRTERPAMTITVTTAWWWVPTAYTVLVCALMYIPTDRDPVRCLLETILALGSSLVFWIVGGFLK